MSPHLDIYRSAQALIRKRYEETAPKSAWRPVAMLKTGERLTADVHRRQTECPKLAKSRLSDHLRATSA